MSKMIQLRNVPHALHRQLEARAALSNSHFDAGGDVEVGVTD
jgi:plasmid stability protein